MNRTIDPAYNREVEKITEDEVVEDMKRIKKRKAPGPDEIPVEAWKTLVRTGKRWLKSVF